MARHNLLGVRGEEAAARFLMFRDYSILEQNWRVGHLEVDIIAQKRGLLIFVEVKTLADTNVILPEDLRVERVMKRDGISAQTVRKWISMQLDEKQKMLRADYIIYNNGEADMQGEVRKLILGLSERLKRGL